MSATQEISHVGYSNNLAIISSAVLAVVKRILSKPVTFMAILK